MDVPAIIKRPLIKQEPFMGRTYRKNKRNEEIPERENRKAALQDRDDKRRDKYRIEEEEDD